MFAVAHMSRASRWGGGMGHFSPGTVRKNVAEQVIVVYMSACGIRSSGCEHRKGRNHRQQREKGSIMHNGCSSPISSVTGFRAKGESLDQGVCMA